MGKKKIKRGRKGGFFGMLGAFFRGCGWLLWKIVPWLAIVAVVVFAGLKVKQILYEDRYLRVQEIKVIPPEVLSPQSIRTLEGKILGKNILGLDLRKIESQIELGPGAQSVRVVREMPSTLRIEIKKRNPIANVQLKANGPYAIVADDGYIIDSRKEADPAWILIEDYSEPVKEPKVGVRITNKGFLEALRFLAIYRRHELSRSETLTRIMLDPYGNVSIRLGAGPDFQLGRKPTERFSQLAKAVSFLHTNPEAGPREGIEYMDLQYDRVAVKRKS